MKKYLSISFLLLCSHLLIAQGIAFDHTLSWNDVLARARKEQKFIFIDCFTTWCGPCKVMAKDVFTQKEVGDYMNAGFISIKLQMDSTAKDDQYVQSWRRTTDSIASAFSVSAYPTYLFLSPDGKMAHRAVGMTTGEKFIEMAKQAKRPQEQYYAFINQALQKDEKDTALILKAAAMARKAVDEKRMVELIEKYLSLQANPFTPENLVLTRQYMSSTASPFFAYFKANEKKIDAIMGSGWVTGQCINLILAERAFPFAPRSGHPDYKMIKDSISTKYPEAAAQATACFKVHEHTWNGERDEFVKAVKAYFAQYPNGVGYATAASFALGLANYSNDSTDWALANKWIESAMRYARNAQTLSTFAVIQYKMGNRAIAIKNMEEAIAAAEREGIKKQLEERLGKMRAE